MGKGFVVLLLAATVAGPAGTAGQKYIDGVFLGIETGDVVELIAWAEGTRGDALKMANGFIEDVPVIPRTYRMLVNMPGWNIIGVLLVNGDIFSKSSEQLETRMVPFSRVRLAINTFEVGVPALENWDSVLRLRRSLKVTPDKPLYVFLVINNGVVSRYYPFRVDRGD